MKLLLIRPGLCCACHALFYEVSKTDLKRFLKLISCQAWLQVWWWNFFVVDFVLLKTIVQKEDCG